MTDHLATLLVRISDELPAVDAVGPALQRARTIRRRHRITGTVATVAAAAVIVVGVPVALHEHNAAPTPTHQIRGECVFKAPGLEPKIIRPPLDLAGLDALPVGDLGLPADLTPSKASTTPPGKALMVTKERRGDQQVFYALDTHMDWHELRVQAPADIGNGLGPMLDADALSPDGTEVALRGAHHVYVVDLATGRTTSRSSTGGSSARWTGSHTLRLVDYRAQETSDGDHVISVGSKGYAETVGAREVVSARLPSARSYDMQGPVAAAKRLAVTASPSFVGRADAPGPGLLVLRRPDYRGLAFLPIDDSPESSMAPRARAWINDHTVLFSVVGTHSSAGTVSATSTSYLTWDTDTGTVRREAAAGPSWRDSSWATGLLGR